MVSIQRPDLLKMFHWCPCPQLFWNILSYPDSMLTALYTLEFWCSLDPNNWTRSEYLTQYLPVYWFVSKFDGLTLKRRWTGLIRIWLITSLPISLPHIWTEELGVILAGRGLALQYRVGTAGHTEPCARLSRRRHWLRKEHGPNSDKGTKVKNLIVPEEEGMENNNSLWVFWFPVKMPLSTFYSQFLSWPRKCLHSHH